MNSTVPPSHETTTFSGSTFSLGDKSGAAACHVGFVDGGFSHCVARVSQSESPIIVEYCDGLISHSEKLLESKSFSHVISKGCVGASMGAVVSKLSWPSEVVIDQWMIA